MAPTTALSEALARGRRRIEAGLAHQMERASAQDRLRPGVDPAAAIDTLVLTMQGLMALARAGAAPPELQRRARSVVATLAG